VTVVQLLWIGLFLPILAVEVWAIAYRRQATLSRAVWDAMAAWWFRAPFFALWFWLTWHWIVEWFWLPQLRGDWVSDVLVAVAGALAGIAARPIIEEVTDDPGDTR